MRPSPQPAPMHHCLVVDECKLQYRYKKSLTIDPYSGNLLKAFCVHASVSHCLRAWQNQVNNFQPAPWLQQGLLAVVFKLLAFLNLRVARRVTVSAIVCCTGAYGQSKMRASTVVALMVLQHGLRQYLGSTVKCCCSAGLLLAALTPRRSSSSSVRPNGAFLSQYLHDMSSSSR